MPELIINDKPVQVPDGLNIIQAARRVGVEIPHFCFHPGLKVVGSCRMCQVEIEQNGRKRIDLACSNAAADGLIVRTDTPAVVKAVRGVLEFLLMNHPTDCPICDDAGECKLQNYYMLHGLYDSRLDVPKWHKPKVYSLGPTVLLDAERCVLCSRCVRFCDEIWGERQLGIFGHGSNEMLINYPGVELNNPYSENVVDLCPVGALLSKDFRYQRRVWYLKSYQSVCPLCSRGCNIYLHIDEDHDYKQPGKRAFRVKPRYNPDVNRWWICDRGRFGYKFIDDPARALTPRVENRDASWEEALAKVENLLLGTLKKPGGAGNIAVLIAPTASNEDAFAALRLFRDLLKLPHLDYEIPSVEKLTADHLLLTDDPHPNRRGFKDLGYKSNGGMSAQEIAQAALSGRLKGLIAAGTDLRGMLGDQAVALAEKLEWLVVVSDRTHDLWSKATVALPIAVYAERPGTFTNVNGLVQKFERALSPRGSSQPQWRIWQNLAQRLGAKWHYEDEYAVYRDLAKGKAEYEALNWHATFGVGKGCYADNW